MMTHADDTPVTLGRLAVLVGRDYRTLLKAARLGRLRASVLDGHLVSTVRDYRTYAAARDQAVAQRYGVSITRAGG